VCSSDLYTKSLLASVPYPDLDRLLDFEEIMKSGAHDVNSWGGAFSASEIGALGQIRVGNDHFVLANENCDTTELSA